MLSSINHQIHYACKNPTFIKLVMLVVVQEIFHSIVKYHITSKLHTDQGNFSHIFFDWE